MNIGEKLKSRYADKIEKIETIDDKSNAFVKPEAIIDICRFAHDDPDLSMDYLECLTAIDWQDRFEVVYHLFSIEKGHWLVLRAGLPHDDPKIETVTSVWRAADWFEREVFDLFGIEFLGHPDLRRIMMPDDWIGHPLRKDYTFIDDPNNPIGPGPP
jgi:NADH-quinone oxidoreductase subunit C